MNIDTENLRTQLNSCSRTQDEVTKESITKGKFLEFFRFFALVKKAKGVGSVAQSAESIVKDVWKVWHDKGNMVCKGKIVITKKYLCLHFELASKIIKNDRAPVHNSV